MNRLLYLRKKIEKCIDILFKILYGREDYLKNIIVADMESSDNTKEIAKKLGISEKTVRNHISNVMQKLGVKGRACAVIELIKLNEITL